MQNQNDDQQHEQNPYEEGQRMGDPVKAAFVAESNFSVAIFGGNQQKQEQEHEIDMMNSSTHNIVDHLLQDYDTAGSCDISSLMDHNATTNNSDGNLNDNTVNKQSTTLAHAAEMASNASGKDTPPSFAHMQMVALGEDTRDATRSMNRAVLDAEGEVTEKDKEDQTLTNKKRQTHEKKTSPTFKEKPAAAVNEEQEFLKRLEELKDYRKVHGDILVPLNYGKLGSWMKAQRVLYKNYKETKEAAEERTSTHQESMATRKRKRDDRSLSPVTCSTIERRMLLLESEGGFTWPLPTKMDKKWNERFEQLLEFKRQHRHCRVPEKYPPNPQLATWVSTQRSQYRQLQKNCQQEQEQAQMKGTDKNNQGGNKSTLKARVEKLNGIGFDWGREICLSGNATTDLVDWHTRFQQLIDYQNKIGNSRVPRSYPTNQPLANWVHTQRKQYKLLMAGKPSLINKEKVALLGNIGFSFAIRSTPDKVDWNDRFEQLKKFKLETGHLLVPRKYKENPKLGTWVQTQREQYKLYKSNQQSHITKERIKKLESLAGWVWVARDRATWDDRYEELCRYRQAHGDCLIPYRYPANPQLGGWVRTQREQYKLLHDGKPSHMTEERIQKLNDINFVWSLFDVWSQQDDTSVLEKALKDSAEARSSNRHQEIYAAPISSSRHPLPSSSSVLQTTSKDVTTKTTDPTSSTADTVIATETANATAEATSVAAEAAEESSAFAMQLMMDMTGTTVVSDEATSAALLLATNSDYAAGTIDEGATINSLPSLQNDSQGKVQGKSKINASTTDNHEVGDEISLFRKFIHEEETVLSLS